MDDSSIASAILKSMPFKDTEKTVETAIREIYQSSPFSCVCLPLKEISSAFDVLVGFYSPEGSTFQFGIDKEIDHISLQPGEFRLASK